MIGKSYKHGRTVGRAGMNSDIRMSNRAEVGMAFPGLIILIVMFLLFFSLFS